MIRHMMNEVLRDLLSFRLKGKRKFKRVFNKKSSFISTDHNNIFFCFTKLSKVQPF